MQNEIAGDPQGLVVDAGVRLDLAIYELPREQVRRLDVEYLLRPAGELEGLGIRQPQLLLCAQGSLPHAQLEGVLGYEGDVVADVQGRVLFDSAGALGA
jgi:hypothetical protein